jgi:hypothetical protein
LNDTGVSYPIHAGAFAARKSICSAEDTFVPTVLLEPMQTELGVSIEIVLGEEAESPRVFRR